MIRQEIALGAPVEKIYQILTNSQRFSEMTGGAPADITTEQGALFSCVGGMIHGRNIELVENKRILQAWRAKPWSPGLYSIVSFEYDYDDVGNPIYEKLNETNSWFENRRNANIV